MLNSKDAFCNGSLTFMYHVYVHKYPQYYGVGLLDVKAGLGSIIHGLFPM